MQKMVSVKISAEAEKKSCSGIKKKERTEPVMQDLERGARRRVPMSSSEELNCLDLKYFSIITTAAYDVKIISRNTASYWYLHNSEYPEQGDDNSSSIGIGLSIRILYY